MNILVTGGAGYIGSHTVLQLIENGNTPIIIDNLSNASAQVITVLEELSHTKIAFYRADLRDTEALKEIFAQDPIDAVIHFAALKAVGESVEQPLAYYDNNVGGTLSLLVAMQEAGVYKMVYSSSATVYGRATKMPLKEDAPISSADVANPYGRTKVICEGMLQDLCTSDARFAVASLRYFNPIGAHPSGRIGDDPQGVPNNLMPYITRVAAGELEEVLVFGDDYETPDGTGIRDYVHIDDLAAGHLAALDYLKQHNGFEAFNLGNGKGYSVLEVIAAFSAANSMDIPYRIAPRRAGDVARSLADPTKANATLHWRAAKNLEQMCRDAWRWQQFSSEKH